jgi:hypothetical protein
VVNCKNCLTYMVKDHEGGNADGKLVGVRVEIPFICGTDKTPIREPLAQDILKRIVRQRRPWRIVKQQQDGSIEAIADSRGNSLYIGHEAHVITLVSGFSPPNSLREEALMTLDLLYAIAGERGAYPPHTPFNIDGAVPFTNGKEDHVDVRQSQDCSKFNEGAVTPSSV